MADDAEIEAMGKLADLFSALDAEARTRVLRWACDRYGVRLNAGLGRLLGIPGQQHPAEPSRNSDWPDVASFFDAVNPSSEADKALTVSYWLQELQGQPTFEAQPVNTELKHLGHGISNITRALDSLIDRKPRLVIQTQKAGSSRQARKKYKVTNEGVRRIKTLLAGTATEEI